MPPLSNLKRNKQIPIPNYLKWKQDFPSF
jgi:hypothetical protein